MLQRSRYRKSCLQGRPPRGSLPHLFIYYLFQCLLFVSAVSAPACSKHTPARQEAPPGQADSITITVQPSWPAEIVSLDIFIYEDRGIRRLIYHSNKLRIPEPGVDFIAVAIANAPGRIDAAALGSFDAMEALTMNYSSELTQAPLMSGMVQSKGRDTVRIALTPLLCEVRLLSVDNLLEDRPLLRNPRVYFRGANEVAQVMRQDGFRPSRMVESPEGMRSPELFLAYLNEDIGYFRCEPGISLYCYPNDSPVATLGTPRTELVLEAEAGGETLCFPTELPALLRGSVTPVRVVIDDNSPIYCKKSEN